MSALKDAQHAKTPSLALPALLITTFFGITLAAPPRFKTVPFPSLPCQLTYYRRFLPLEYDIMNVLNASPPTLFILIGLNVRLALKSLARTAMSVSLTQ